MLKKNSELPANQSDEALDRLCKVATSLSYVILLPTYLTQGYLLSTTSIYQISTMNAGI